MDDVNVQPWQRIPGTFKEIADRVGPGYCDPACTLHTKVNTNRGDEVTSDILLLRSSINKHVPVLTTSLFPGGDAYATRGDVQFNSCDETKKTYEHLVHEAGHALGIAGGNTGANPAEAHHPNMYISESTMSYGAKQGCFPVTVQSGRNPQWGHG